MTTVAASFRDTRDRFVGDKSVASISAMRSLRADDDLQLILRVAAKDQQALTILYQRYAPRLGRFLSKLLKNRELVGEALNDTMLVLWRKASQFDPDRACLSTWLFGTARRAGLMALARSAKENVLPIGEERDRDEADVPHSNQRSPARSIRGSVTGANRSHLRASPRWFAKKSCSYRPF